MTSEEKLREICFEIGTANDTNLKPGAEIVIVGSGIKSASQFTLGALSEIQSANEVYYCINETVTETFLRSVCPNACDLSPLWDTNKEPYHSDVQISEVCLHQARKGLKVCLVLAGHPCVNSVPMQRIRRIAKAEGIPFLSLPGPSLVDSLLADLCFDPNTPCIQQINAIDILENKRKVNTDFNVIITNIGNIESDDKLILLGEKMQSIYEDDVEIVVYTASIYPMFSPKITYLSLKSIPDHGNIELTDRTLFFIAPKTSKTTDFEMLIRLRFSQGNTPAQFTESSKGNKDDYGDYENNAIKELENWCAPKTYCYPESSNLSEMLTDLSLNSAITRKLDFKEIPSLEEVRNGPILASQIYKNPMHVDQETCNQNNLRKQSKRYQPSPKSELPIQLVDSDSEFEDFPVENDSSESEEEIQGPRSQHIKNQEN